MAYDSQSGVGLDGLDTNSVPNGSCANPPVGHTHSDYDQGMTGLGNRPHARATPRRWTRGWACRSVRLGHYPSSSFDTRLELRLRQAQRMVKTTKTPPTTRK